MMADGILRKVEQSCLASPKNLSGMKNSEKGLDFGKDLFDLQSITFLSSSMLPNLIHSIYLANVEVV